MSVISNFRHISWSMWFWGGPAMVAFWLWLMPSILSAVVPPDRYFDAGTVYVENAPVGTAPRIVFDRIIKHNFLGEWQGTVWRVEGGTFVRVPDCRKSSDAPFTYRTTASLSPSLSLNEWLEIPPNSPCDLTPGKYKLVTVWRIYPRWLPYTTLTVERHSNVFTITE